MVLALDAISIFEFHQRLSRKATESPVDYQALVDAVYAETQIQTDFDTMIAFVSINRRNEGQQRFCEFLRSIGFTVDETDYRDTFITSDRSIQKCQLSTQIAYLTGLLVQDNDEYPPHLFVITNSFDLYYPFLDYVEQRDGKVTIVFFRCGMEERWNRVGLFNDDSPVSFLDLSDHAGKILGFDLSVASGRYSNPNGLASLNF